MGDGREGFELGRDILALAAITTGAALQEEAMLIEEFYCQAVNLGLSHIGEGLGGDILIEKTEQAVLKGIQVAISEGVFQAEHGQTMHYLRKFIKGYPAWPLTGGIGRDKLGMLFFQPQKLMKKQVVFAVSDQWIIEVVIAMGVFLEKDP
jgi:hypothetical protein